jgi:hypothetical protein
MINMALYFAVAFSDVTANQHRYKSCDS